MLRRRGAHREHGRGDGLHLGAEAARSLDVRHFGRLRGVESESSPIPQSSPNLDIM